MVNFAGLPACNLYGNNVPGPLGRERGMRRVWRRIVIGIGLAELVAGLGFIALFLQDTSDPLGRSIGQGVAMVYGIVLAVAVLPGLLLAWHGRFLPLATALVVAGPPLLFYLMARA
jgi:hypothetical protein